MLEASVGAPQRHRTLTVFPIIAEKDRRLPYLLLAEALAQGKVTIQEVGSGTVPTLAVVNAGQRPVLVLDGEQLIGAKQNRMTNRTLLLSPESRTEIPVSCMEQGRWHFVSDAFRSTPHHAPSKVRSRARGAEARARQRTGRVSHRDLASAQGEVWEEIRSYAGKLGGGSETGALDALYAGRAGELDRWMEAFPPVDRQVGILAFLGGRPLGLDALGSGTLYQPLHRRLLTGYILDALSEGGEDRPEAAASGPDRPGAQPPREADALRFISAVAKAERTTSETPGLGEYRVLAGGVLGGELIHDSHLVHLSAFPLEVTAGQDEDGPEHGPGGPIQGPRYRRRFR